MKQLKSIIKYFKIAKKKLIKLFVSFLLLWSFTGNLAQSAPLPGAEGFSPPIYICRRRETYSRQATGLKTHLNQNPNDANIPKENKARHDVYISELGCILKDNQIQKKYKHAVDFGITGNPNRENFELFKKKLVEHMTDPGTKSKNGTFKNNIPVIHYYSENTGLNVMIRQDDNTFLSGWALTDNQLENVKNRGKL